MGFFKWSLKTEKEQKKNYIKLCRSIRKKLEKDKWLESAGEDAWDHSFSLSVAYSSHLSLEIVSSPVNLEIMPRKSNLRKGERCYVRVEELINRFNSWDRKDEYLKWLSSNFKIDYKLTEPIRV
jgi:hypothetical protein